jgi:flagellar hook-basal body complex protein FliE
MDVRLKPFDFSQAVARAGLRLDGMPASGPAAAGKVQGGESFGTAMQQALRGVSAAQRESSRLQREVQLDNPTVSLEQTMVAMERASLGFQAVVQVRNRLVSAYTDIMNMQV